METQQASEGTFGVSLSLTAEQRDQLVRGEPLSINGISIESPTLKADIGEKQELRIAFMPETADQKKRTIRCCAYSGAKVQRYNWRTDEIYDLVLSMESGACRMQRMNGGAPVCNAHSTWRVENVLGVVEKCFIENGKLMADVRFSAREDITPIWEDVLSGILRNWSIGLWVHKTRDITQAQDTRQQMEAIDWEPFELSLVPVPADKDAVSMAAETAGQTNLTGPIAQKGPQPMETTIEQQPGNEARVDQAAVNAAATTAALEAVRNERLRVSSINELCVRFKMTQEFTTGLTNDGNMTVDQARVKIMDQLAADAEKQPSTRSVHVLRDGGDTMRETMAAALLFRYDPVAHKDKADLAAQWRSCRMLELGKYCLEAKGEPWRGKSANEIAMAALTRSDFPNILADVSNKTLRNAYEAAPQTFRPFTKRATAADFKNINRVQLSGAPRLLPVNENGEFEQGALTDSKETYLLVTWGRLVNISRQTIINDDLNALTRIPAALGAKASQRESDVVWAIVTANAAMADGYNLFSSQHANLGTTGAISVTTMDEGYTLMSLQTDPSGDVLNLEPKFILVPTGKRAITNQFLNPTQFSPAAFTSVIPGYMQNLQVIAESRLQTHSATAWYLAADPDMIDTIEYCYLEGNEGVYQETEMGFAVDGMRIKVRLDFAAAAIDHRGLFKNVGS